MTPQELKNSILQLAIQGRLVEQRPEEGTGEELLRKILRHGIHGTTRTHRTGSRVPCRVPSVSVVPSVPPEEQPFDIPESWVWVRLGDAFDIEMGQSPDGASVSEAAGGLEFHQGKIYFGDKYLKQSPQQTTAPTKIAEPNSVLLCVRAPVGKVNMSNRRICIGRGLCSVSPLAGMDVNFVYYLLAAFETTFVRHATGTTFVAITGKVVKMFPVPLPPLAEQKRIVAKIEELLPLIDRYEKAWDKLEEFNRRFPVDMQKSVLQMAIQGKLVEQRPEEGTGEELYRQIQAEKQRLVKAGKIKKEKPLPEITDDEIPFEIPESWRWVRLNEVCNVSDGTHQTPRYVEKGKPFISAQNIKPYRFLPDIHRDVSEKDFLEYNKNVAPAKGDILMTRVGAGIGEAAIINQDFEFSIYVSLTLIKRYAKEFNMEYLLHVINSPLGKQLAKKKTLGKGASQGNLNLVFIREFVFPLPPLAEQKRIVARLEEILPLCERLK